MRLGDLADIGAGQGAPQESAAFGRQGSPFIRASSLEPLCANDDYSQVEHISPSIAHQFGLRLYPAGTVVFAKSGMSATKNRVYRLSRPAHVVNHLATVSPSAAIDSAYLRYWLEDFDPTHLIKDSSYPSISQQDIADLVIQLPDIDVQQAIALRLMWAERLHYMRRYALELTETFLVAVFRELFGNPVTNELEFPRERLEDLIQPTRPITYGILKPGPHVPDGVPYVRVTDIESGRILLGQVRRTSPTIDAGYRRSKLEPGDLLMSIRGHVGRMAIVPGQLRGANITQDTARLAPIAELDVHYLQGCLNAPAMQSLMQALTRGVAVTGINLGDVKELPIPIPPVSLQQKFAKVVQHVELQRFSQLEALRQVEHLFQTLLHEAFRS